tara:strand:+ start:4020 stop:4859 length:840 start_codon:yes stop_codon:yes gene_type:complete
MPISLIVSCDDQPGLIHSISSVLILAKESISKLEEHVEHGRFFCRVQWQNDAQWSIAKWQETFQPFFYSTNATFSFKDHHVPTKIGLFCSKYLHCLYNVLNHIQMGDLHASIEFVVSNHIDASAMVKHHGVPFIYLPVDSFSKEMHETQVMNAIQPIPVDFIGLARYMRILSPKFLQKNRFPIINVHHSFLPSFIGANPYQQAHDRGVKLIGATAHFVTSELDAGPIIHQQVVNVSHLDSPDRLQQLGKTAEMDVFLRALQKQCENKLIEFNGRTVVFN